MAPVHFHNQHAFFSVEPQMPASRRVTLHPEPLLRVQDHFMAPVHFHEQYNTFHSYGYGAAPEGALMVGDQASYVSRDGATTLHGQRSPKRQRVAKPVHTLLSG